MCVTSYIHWLIKVGKMPPYCVWTLPSSAIDSIERELKMSGIPYSTLDCRKGKEHEIKKYVVNIVTHDHLRLNGFEKSLRSISSGSLFIADEFHKAMAKTKRSSIILDIVRLSYDFIGLSGTIVKDTNIDELIIWLQQIVEFEVTQDNYWVAVGALVSRKVETHTSFNRSFVEAEVPDEYYELVPSALGGSASEINFREALLFSYRSVTLNIIKIAKEYLSKREKIFIIAKDVENQKEIAKALKKFKVFSIDSKNQITLSPDDNTDIDVVITTVRH